MPATPAHPTVSYTDSVSQGGATIPKPASSQQPVASSLQPHVAEAMPKVWGASGGSPGIAGNVYITVVALSLA